MPGPAALHKIIPRAVAFSFWNVSFVHHSVSDACLARNCAHISVWKKSRPVHAEVAQVPCFRWPDRAGCPTTLVPPGQRVYAVGDIHGRLDLFEQMIALIEADDAARNSECPAQTPVQTTVILLGDLIDRGRTAPA
jgi:hypothetical protein